MSSVSDEAHIRHSLRQLEQQGLEPPPYGECDCTSYCYFLLSVVLFALGVLVTVVSLGTQNGYACCDERYKWFVYTVGPIFICGALSVAVKNVVYLRRKGITQMLLHQQDLLRNLQELAQQSRSQQSSGGGSCVIRNPSTVTLPPTYEALMGASSASQGAGSTEAPPPTYEEAMFLIGDEKLRVVLEESKYAASSEDELSKQQQGATAAPESVSPSQHKPQSTTD